MAEPAAARQQANVGPGTFCHVEIPIANPATAKEFFGDVFGWTFQDVPMGEGGYTLFETREGAIGGGMMEAAEGVPKQIVNYIRVDEIEPMVKRIEEKGGKIVVPKTEIPGFGWMVHFTDPDGNLFGLWKTAHSA